MISTINNDKLSLIYNNSKYSVVDYYRKCELRYFKEATLGKVRPLIEITLGDLNVTFSEREYRDAISTWQNYILDSVEQRLNSSIKSRDEKKEQALNGDNNLWSDDLKELFSKEEYENQKSNGELEFENGTVFSVVNKEIQKIDIKYLSDEEPHGLAPISFRGEASHSTEGLSFPKDIPSGATLLFPNGLRAHFGSGTERMLMELLEKSLVSHVLP